MAIGNDIWMWAAGQHACGVTDSIHLAWARVRECLAVGELARVEKVEILGSCQAMSYHYEPQGTGWTATRDRQGLHWQHLTSEIPPGE